MSGINIHLTRKDGSEQTADYSLNISVENYRSNFLKVTQSITYFKNNKFTLNFSKRTGTVYIYHYYTKEDYHIVEKIEVYFSNQHLEIPLIIGFKRKGNSETKYFTYIDIVKAKTTFGVPGTGEFGPSKLYEKLNNENKNRNKITFYKTKGQRENYDEEIDNKSFPNYVRYKYFVKDDEKYVNRKMSKDKLLEKEQLNDTTNIDLLLDKLDKKSYDFISAYYAENNTLLLIEFIDDSTKTHFQRKNKDGYYWVNREVKYNSNNDLKIELDKIKSSIDNLIFKLEKNKNDNKYNGNITVSSQPQSLGFTKYSHIPNKSKNSFVLYNESSFEVIKIDETFNNKLDSVQDILYKKIETYSLNEKPNFHLLIKFTQMDESKEHYFYRYNNEGTQWKQFNDNTYLRNDENIKYKLLEFYYKLQSSLVLQINEKNRYNSGTISNLSETINTSNTFAIVPQASSSCGTYNIYKHGLSAYDPYYKTDDVGIRLKYINSEIKLYKGVLKEENRQYIYYKKSNRDFYVFFYGDDPRPLLLCYQNQAYIPQSKDKYDSQWVLVQGVQKCVCNDGDNNNDALLKGLTQVVGFLNEVQLDKNPVNDGGAGSSLGNGSSFTYDVHTYNGTQIKISVKCEQVNSGSCYKKLTHTPAGLNGKAGTGFRLGNVTYNGTSGTFKGSISYYKSGATFSQTNKYKPLVKVIAYFYYADTKYAEPLLVELVFGNGVDNGKDYYKLKINGVSKGLKWEKDEKATIAIGEKGDKLPEYLDSIRYGIKKVLKVELQHNTSRQYKAYWSTQPGKTSGGFEPMPSGVGSSGNHIRVQDCKNCEKLKKNNYVCFQHKLSDLGPEVLNQIGGIALTLPGTRDDTPIELKLNNGSENGYQPIEQLTYNRCMGDIYVYFYGDDPRPLMLCYNGNAYKPKDKSTYESTWVLAPGVECACDGSRFDLTPLLEQLYGLSMFLNEVKLEETGNAFEPETRGTKSYKYSVHNYNKTDFKIVVSGQNLNCYKQYSHKPEKSGYRLGNITYNGMNGINASLIYPKEKDLDQVFLYYNVYDIDHSYPLLVELRFKGDSKADNEYHILKDKNAKTWEKVDINNEKTLFEKLLKEETIESGLYDIRKGLEIKYNDEQKKTFLFDPENCTEDKINIPAVVGGTVGGVAGAGGVGGAVFYAFKKLTRSYNRIQH